MKGLCPERNRFVMSGTEKGEGVMNGTGLVPSG